MGTSGCVSFMFDKKGVIFIEKSDDHDEDTIMEIALEAGADDFIADDEGYEIITSPEAYQDVVDALTQNKIQLLSAEITMLPQTYSAVEEEHAKKVEKMIDMFEEDDDIQEIFTNIEN